MINVQQLTTCDQEPIHLLSKIQQSGFMFVLDYENLIILQVSDNCSRLLHKEPNDLLETCITKQLPSHITKRIETIITLKNKEQKTHIFYDSFQDKRLFFALHLQEDYLVLEISDVTIDQNEAKEFETKEEMIKRSVVYCENLLTFHELVDEIAKSVQEISGFDRVLVYKFDQDNHGTVLSEVNKNFDDSFIGHRFPASDIPIQARALYVKNRFRIIENTEESNALLIPTLNKITNQPLDMSMCYLRSVSPIHIEYLKNMGVMASMSLSIVIDGKLWGLIACHHKTPKKIALSAYEIYHLLSTIFSAQIHQKEILDQYKLSSKLELKRELYFTGLNQYVDNSFLEALQFEKESLQTLIECDGVVVLDNDTILINETPLKSDEIFHLERIVNEKPDEFFVTSNLGMIHPEVLEFTHKLGGILAITPPTYKNIRLLFIKYEQIHSVLWAGKPTKNIQMQDGMIVINPRASFESWRETVIGSSFPFLQEEINSVKIFAQKLETSFRLFEKYEETKKIKKEKQEQEEKFQEQKLASIGEVVSNIAHQWRQPLNVITLVASGNQLKNECGTLTSEIINTSMEKIISQSQYLSKTIDDFRNFLANTQEISQVSIVAILQKAIQLYDTTFQNNTIEIHTHLEDDIVIDGCENELITAFMNILYNAVEAVEDNQSKVIFIQTSFTNNGLVVEICDNGKGLDPKIIDKLFEPYFTTKHQSVGTGLGLSIAYKIFHINHKAIFKATNKEFQIDTNCYQGACFSIQFQNA